MMGKTLLTTNPRPGTAAAAGVQRADFGEQPIWVAMILTVRFGNRDAVTEGPADQASTA